jgi:hypothetical protein
LLDCVCISTCLPVPQAYDFSLLLFLARGLRRFFLVRTSFEIYCIDSVIQIWGLYR